MKKVISRIIVLLTIIGLLGFALWEMVIKPSMELYSLYGVLGVIGWLVLLSVVVFACYLFSILFDLATRDL